MSAKAGFPLALVLSLVGLYAAQGADPPTVLNDEASPMLLTGGTEVSVTGPAGMPAAAPMPYTGAGPMSPAPGMIQPTQTANGHSSALSDWMLYTKPECCGPMGSHGPIMAELYVRNGPSIPVGGGVLGAVLNTGWMFQGGGRSLFFNPEMTKAWVVDIGISYNFNQSVGNRQIFMNFTVPDANDLPVDIADNFQLRQLSRTSVNLAVGREWFLYVWQNGGAALRAGAHVGGQLGTIKADWEVVPHTTDMLWAVTLAGNVDLEIPWGGCTLVGGLRTEWNDIFESDIVQHQNKNNLQSVNILFNCGCRF